MWSLPSNTDIKVIDHDKCAACEHVVRRGVCIKCGDVWCCNREFLSSHITMINAPYTLTVDMANGGLRVTKGSTSAQQFGRALRRGAKP